MEIVIAAKEKPPWSIDRGDLERAVRLRWPAATTYDLPGDRPMVVGLVLPYPQGDLQVELKREGTMLLLEAPDLSAAADFAAWWSFKAPALEPEVHVWPGEDYGFSVVLTRGSDTRSLLEALLRC